MKQRQVSLLKLFRFLARLGILQRGRHDLSGSANRCQILFLRVSDIDILSELPQALFKDVCIK